MYNLYKNRTNLCRYRTESPPNSPIHTRNSSAFLPEITRKGYTGMNNSLTFEPSTHNNGI